MSDEALAPTEPNTAEQSPAEAREAPVNTAPTVAKDEPVADASPSDAIPGWPQDRFHPVYGRRSIADPNTYARMGGDDGDWRFKRAADADAARTQPEAELAVAYNLRRKMALIDDAGDVPVSNSVQAHESAASGNPEPGVVLPPKAD